MAARSRKPSPTPEKIVSEVRAIYQELASRPIERACRGLAECCRFRLTGRTPFLTKAEALVAVKGLRATGRTKLPAAADGSCPMLGSNGRCMIYEHRPFGCRTHFCAAAGGPYARREVADLIYRLEDLSRTINGQEAMPLPAAMENILSGR